MDDSSERRFQHRLPIQVHVRYQTIGEFIEDWSANISVGGMYIQTREPLPVGTRLRLEFSLPGMRRPVLATAQVRWQVRPEDGGERIPGMGVRFEQLSSEDQRRVSRAAGHPLPTMST